MTDWCGGSGQVKWLTDVVAGGKSNDWLMWWYGNALCLSIVLALSLVLALALALTDDVVAVGKSNDWLMWWQGACQMTDWCSDTVSCMSSASTSSISSAGSSSSTSSSASARDTSYLAKLSLPQWRQLQIRKRYMKGAPVKLNKFINFP